MIKIYLLDKKNNLKAETYKEYVYLPNSFVEIRKEAVKIYKWLKAIENRHMIPNSKNPTKDTTEIEIIDKTKDKQYSAVFIESICLLNYNFKRLTVLLICFEIMSNSRLTLSCFFIN